MLMLWLLQGGEEAAVKLQEAQEELNSTRRQLSICLLREGKPSENRLLQVSSSAEASNRNEVKECSV